MTATPKQKRPRRNVPAQEETVSALWEFARAIGAPITDERGVIIDQRINAIGPALESILAAFGYVVTEIQ